MSEYGRLDGAGLRARARALDDRRAQLAGDCEDLLVDLRDSVAAGERALDPVGVLDARLERICWQLATVDSVLWAVAASHAEAEDIHEAGPWWHADLQERTHMDLRRWLDGCLRDGRLSLRLFDFPVHIRGTEGDRLLSASDGMRAVERVVRPIEQEWLLAHWPPELRETNDTSSEPPGGVRGRLA